MLWFGVSRLIVAASLAVFCSEAAAQAGPTIRSTALESSRVSDEASTSQDPSCIDKATLDPTLSTSFLLEPPKPGGPFIVIGYYDLARGLLAGYQSSTGKRILQQAAWRPNGRVTAAATHVDPQTGRLKTFYGPRMQDGRGTVQFAGVDIRSYLRDARTRTPGPRADEINEFIDSDSGQAFFEAMPALYSVLETLETDPKLAALQAPFGVLTTALQIATTKYGGFNHADSVLGAGHANTLRSNCQGASCAFSGKRFTIHKNGLFDVVSKKKTVASKRAPGQCAASSAVAGPFLGIAPRLKNGDGVCDVPGDCFGRCGQGCDGQPWMGNVYTPQCWGHDLCVCMWSDSDCIFFTSDNPPTGIAMAVTISSMLP